MGYIDNSKPWFETGDYPTQEQFAQVFEWLRWKDERVVADDLSPELLAAINAGAAPVEIIVSTGADIVYTVADGYLLEKILTVTDAPATPSCSYTDGDQIIGPRDEGVTKDVWTVDVFAVGASVDVTVFGLPSGGKAIFLKRKIL